MVAAASSARRALVDDRLGDLLGRDRARQGRREGLEQRDPGHRALRGAAPARLGLLDAGVAVGGRVGRRGRAGRSQAGPHLGQQLPGGDRSRQPLAGDRLVPARRAEQQDRDRPGLGLGVEAVREAGGVEAGVGQDQVRPAREDRLGRPGHVADRLDREGAAEQPRQVLALGGTRLRDQDPSTRRKAARRGAWGGIGHVGG